MLQKKSNEPQKRISLISFLMSPENRPSVILILIGVAVAYLGAVLIPDQTFSIIVSLIGAVISLTATDQIIKRIPKE